MLQHAVISRGVLQHALWPRQGDNPPWAPSVAQWQSERNRAVAAESNYSDLYMAARDALGLLRGAGADPTLRRWAVERASMALEDAGVVLLEERSPSV